MKTYLEHKLESQTGLFRTDFTDGYVVWKPLTWLRYKKYREAHLLLGDSIELQLEETVFKECLIFSSYEELPPDDLTPEETSDWLDHSRATVPAGVVSTVVKLILFTSGAQNGSAIIAQLDQHRGPINNIEDQLIVAICRAFPAYTPEYVENLDWQTILKRAAQAELILGTKFELADPHAEEKERQAQKFSLQKDIQEITRSRQGQQSMAQSELDEMKAEKRRMRDEYMKRHHALTNR